MAQNTDPRDLTTQAEWSDDPVAAERERLAAERQARRDARVAALNPTPEPEVPLEYQRREYETAPVSQGSSAAYAAAEPEVVRVTERTTHKPGPSLGLLLLRLVTAGIMGVHGMQKLLDLPATTEMLGTTVLPSPEIMALVIGAAEVLIAIALVFGLLTRLAGLGVALIGAGALALVYWGPWSPFQPGKPGFAGELELLLVAVGLTLLLVGPGGWSLDRSFFGRSKKTTTA